MEDGYIAISKMAKKTKVSVRVIKRMVLSGAVLAIKKTKPTSVSYSIHVSQEEKIKELHQSYLLNYN